MDISYILVALFLSFLGGTTPLIHKLVLQKLNKITIMVIGGFIYYALLLVLLFVNYDIIKKDVPKITYKDIGLIAFVSGIVGFVGNLLYLYVLKKHSSSIISALVYSSPIFTLLLAYALNTEKIAPLGIIGILLVVKGIICIAFNDSFFKLEEYRLFD